MIEEEEVLDDAEDDGEENVEVGVVKRPRGRPPGSKIAPRPAAWVCAGLVDGRVIQEKFVAPEESTDEEKKNYSAEKAMTAFSVKYKTVSDILIDGPFHEKRSVTSSQSSKKKEVISVLPTEYEMGEREDAGAIFNNWEGLVYKLRAINSTEFQEKYGVSDKDCCVFFPLEDCNKKTTNKKRANPGLNIVLYSSLEFNKKEPATINT